MNKFIAIAALLFIFTGCKKDSQQLNDGKLSNQTDKLMSTGPLTQQYNLNNWMGSMGDLTKLSQLSIPGTHNTAARVEYIWSTAKCQDLSVTDQLNSGVRFLDIRCRHIGNAFVIHHGEVYQKINFQDVLNACYEFLNRNPSETILMSVKEEYKAVSNNRSFEQTFDSYVNANPKKWNLEQDLGTLGKLRGKIKLIRRFGANASKGVDASRWQDNTIFDIANPDAALKIQDIYRVSNTNTKAGQVQGLLNEARNSGADKLYINFLSGYKSRWFFGIPDIRSVSDAMNPMLSGYLNANKKGRYGVVNLDFINSNVAKAIVSSNF